MYFCDLPLGRRTKAQSISIPPIKQIQMQAGMSSVNLAEQDGATRSQVRTSGLRWKLAAAITLLTAVVMTGCLGLSTPPSSTALSFAQPNVSFGSVSVGKTKTFTQTVTNVMPAAASTGGLAPLPNTITILQISSSSSSFSVQGITLPITLSPGQSVSFKIAFAPKSSGKQSGALTISTGQTDPIALPLEGMGATPGSLSASAGTLSFGSIQTGTTSSIQETLTNPGTSTITISAISASGSGFSVNGVSAPITLAAGQSVSFNTRFSPTSAGARTGSFIVTSDASNPTLTIPASGTGIADGAVTATPSSVSFGKVQIGVTQSTSATITNSGGSNVTLSAANVAGSDFSISGLSLPLTLGAGQSQNFTVKYKPSSAGSDTGSVTITSDGSNPSLAIPLAGTGVTDGGINSAPSSISFGTVVVGTSQTVADTLTNTGGSSVTISSAATTGAGFSVSGLALPVTLNPGQSASINVKFSPSAVGSPSGSLTISSDGSNPTLMIPLSGNAVADGALTANPSSVNFGTLVVGNNQTVSETLTNSGGSSLKISAATTAGAGFSISGLTLPTTLNSGQSVSFSVKFAPSSTGSANGSVTITSDGSNPNLTIPLSGNAIADGSVTASPTSIAFGSVVVGSSQTTTQTLTNSGGSNLKITGAAASGTGFSVSGISLPVTLSAGQSTSFSVKFTPSSSGSATGNLSITSDGTNPTLNVPLSATGVADGSVSASPSSMSFGSVSVGSSKSMTQTLTNSGGSSLKITAASASGSGFSITGLTLPVTLTAGQTASFTVKFAPSASGSASGNLSITSDGSNPSLTIPLNGSGASAGTLSANPTSLSFGSVQVGNSTSKSETVTNSGGSDVTISGASSSAGAFDVSGLSLPTTLSAGQSVTFTVQFAPSSGGSASGTLTLTSNASNPSLGIGLSGTGTTPGQLAANPTSLSFGSVTVGASASKSASLSASGSAVQVTGVSSDSSEFKVSGISFPVNVGAGSSVSFTVTFTPTSSGSASGTLTFTSNATNSPTQIAVAGSATAPASHSVDLAWAGSSGSGVVGYNIYRATKTGGPYTKINSSLNVDTTFTDSTVAAGTTYFYVVTAVDGSGTESAYSNEAKAIVPSP
jgi:Abnormal spindle-like microcephaly-assoc'd, ASPM-SPD-2-Hydin